MSQLLFVEYPRCTTCKRAKKFLEEANLDFIDRDIVEDNPSATELKEWYEKSGLKIRRFFNTSGVVYREQNIKAQLDAGMTDDECFELLASNGKLVKRPLLVGDNFVLVGFKAEEWAEALGLEA